MQKKINSFFNSSSSQKSDKTTSNFGESIDEFGASKEPLIRIKYTRKTSNPDPSSSEVESTSGVDGQLIEEEKDEKQRLESDKCDYVSSLGRIRNKKRNYAQFHLELGQSDFLLHSCPVCGVSYAKGDEEDEKVHNTFHKNYIHGIPFKGWRHERVVQILSVEGGRIIVVLNDDPSAHKNKVQEVLKMMEIELWDGWIFHELCKVYLFISSQRVAGCLVAEPIDKAYRVLPGTVDNVSHGVTTKEARPKSTELHFGQICLRREVHRRVRSDNNSKAVKGNLVGATFCEEEPVAASCGIRAIWVTPSNRRKHIATHLLDAVRKSFATGSILECTELAFSQPTSSGKALASKYTGTRSFLVYKAT